MNIKKIIPVILTAAVLSGCSGRVNANTVPAAVYASATATEETEPLFSQIVTEGIIATDDIETTPEETTAEKSEQTTTAATASETTESTVITTAPIKTSVAATFITKEEPEAIQTTTTETVTTIPATQKPDKYSNSILILGPNMVYTGESFQYTYKISHKNADRASVLWQYSGDAGVLYTSGNFKAEKKGTVKIKVTDVSNGLSDTLTVHVVDSPEDVDFVPMVNGIPVANKTYPLPKSYNPGLTAETYSAFMELKQAAINDGIEINFMSGYRSYYDQISVYEGWVETYPNGGADRVSARPGHSEHQLGLAIDVNSLVLTFAETEEGKWLAENCYKYGFIIRYTKEGEPITGYIYEPWHIRYLGKELAYDVHFSGLTLEEYLGIDSYYRVEEYVIEE